MQAPEAPQSARSGWRNSQTQSSDASKHINVGLEKKASTGELLHISHIRMDWQPKATGIFERYKKETISKEMTRKWNMGWYRNHQTSTTWINVPIKPWTTNREIDESPHGFYDIPFYGLDALQADNAEEEA